jgi:hypothetical protein
MREILKYKRYVFVGFVFIGLAIGLAAHAILFGLAFGIGLGFLAMSLLVAIVRVNTKPQ